MLELYFICPSFFITWFSSYVWGMSGSCPNQGCGTNGRRSRNRKVYGICFYYKSVLACFTKFEVTVVSSQSTY